MLLTLHPDLKYVVEKQVVGRKVMKQLFIPWKSCLKGSNLKLFSWSMQPTHSTLWTDTFYVHNVSITCSTIVTFVRNCYQTPARLFVKLFVIDEGTTQGNPLDMAIYAMVISSLLDILMQSTEDKQNKLAAFADDVSASGKLLGLRAFWSHILENGPKYIDTIQEF